MRQTSAHPPSIQNVGVTYLPTKLPVLLSDTALMPSL
ncbi:MAG: hypothetical protein ACI9CE_001573 [Flavobacterium sp.]|jgi:hypothetical protein